MANQVKSERSQLRRLLLMALRPRMSFEFRTTFSPQICIDALYKEQSTPPDNIWERFSQVSETTVEVWHSPDNRADFKVNIEDFGVAKVKSKIEGSLNPLEDSSTFVKGEIILNSPFMWYFVLVFWVIWGILTIGSMLLMALGIILIGYGFAFNYFQKVTKLKYIETVLGYREKPKS